VKSDPKKHHRRSTHLKRYDYSQAGAYSITSCTHNREYLLVRGCSEWRYTGKCIWCSWRILLDNLLRHFSHVELDGFVVMPSHGHGASWPLASISSWAAKLA